MTSNLIDNFGETVTVKRFGAGYYSTSTHRYVDGSTGDFDCTMSVQPLNDKEIENQPSGQRSKRWLKGYTYVELLTAEVSAGKKADQVTINSIVFEVRACEKWVGDLSHWKVLLAQMGE